MNRRIGIGIGLLLCLSGCGTSAQSRPVSPTPSVDTIAPSSHPTTPASKPLQAPVVHMSSDTATLSGTIQNSQLQTVVWAGMTPTGPLYPVGLMVDTGATHTMISGKFWQAMGDHPNNATTTFAGIGGNETVRYWPAVYVYPTDHARNPIIDGATEPGGVNRSALGPEGIIILLGQDIISTGTLVQKGTHWTLTYPID